MNIIIKRQLSFLSLAKSLLNKFVLTVVILTSTFLIGSGTLTIASAQETESGAKIGDISDGNRSHPVHLLELFDEEGSIINPNDNFPMPFSPEKTCGGKCHDIAKISSGWHFNTADELLESGRRGEPWILNDPVTGTQIPLSARNWKGTFKPEVVGLTPFNFTEKFGRHMNGGGVSKNDSTDTEDVDTYYRWQVSGKAEINCLSCHDLEAGHDQAEYSKQMRQQNYRWAAAATSGFAMVKGSAKIMPDNYDIYSGQIPDIKDAVPPHVDYDKTRFSKDGKVLFDIAKEADNKRCYFCHSVKDITENTPERWTTEKDVHIAAGMSCVDCHRNGLDHNITRGYESETENSWQPARISFSCKGCHIGEDDRGNQNKGRLGAPKPQHKGLPLVHFEKLSCTACHSGPWPSADPGKVKLSRAHSLGTFGVKKDDNAAPKIISPVFVKGDDGKITPHRLMFPSFWSVEIAHSTTMKQLNVEYVPLAPAEIQGIAAAFILADSVTDSTNIALIKKGDWPVFSEKQMISIFDSLATTFPENDEPVYISGGKLFKRNQNGDRIVSEEHKAGEPYTWAFAHDVRPAQQSLGIKGCADCHSTDSGFIFGKVTGDVPFEFAGASEISKTTLSGLGDITPRVFAATFLVRNVYKILIAVCSVLVFMVLFVYGFRGFEGWLKKL